MPAALKGDVAYYAGNFYNEKGERLLDDGTSFMKFIDLSYAEAYQAKVPYIKRDKNGNILEIIDQKSTTKYIYEYNAKGLLTKSTYSNRLKEYEYDVKDRLKKEIITNTSYNEKVTSTYTYKEEGGMLHVHERKVYTTGGEESFDYSYKDGQLMFSTGYSGKKYECIPDAKGNCTTKKDVKTGEIKTIYSNVIYRDELKAGSITVEKKNDYSTDYTLKVGDRLLSGVTSQFIGGTLYLYVPITGEYLVVENFYDKDQDIKKLPIKFVQKDDPYLAYRGYNDKAYLLVKGVEQNDLSRSDKNYDFFI